MPGTQTGVRVELASEGSASVATGLPVLDHLVGELARTLDMAADALENDSVEWRIELLRDAGFVERKEQK